jgi:hypothetical protein
MHFKEVKMATVIQHNTAVLEQRDNGEPIRLSTWKEVREYYAAHLTPTRFNNGRPVYSNVDIKKLNVILPDEN